MCVCVSVCVLHFDSVVYIVCKQLCVLMCLDLQLCRYASLQITLFYLLLMYTYMITQLVSICMYVCMVFCSCVGGHA